MELENKKRKLDEIFDLYVKYGNKNYIGEELSQLEHATQAALLASADTNNPAIVIGAFLHDIGHLLVFDNEEIPKMGDLGVLNHEKVGADYLRKMGFPDLTCSIVEHHVLTKRYLITKNTAYFNNLSGASKQTFNYQGGKITSKEIIEFEKNPYFNIHIKIRSYDDLAKDNSQEMKERIKKLDPINYFKDIAFNLI